MISRLFTEEPTVRISLWHGASAGGVWVLLALAACSSTDQPENRPKEYTLSTPYPSVRTFAIAPAVNQSGSRDFDPLTVSDKLYEEMQQVHGLSALPVNKTLAAMQRLGMRAIDSPQAAVRLADVLGADAIIVPAITAYDPYNPPTIGMTMQVYAASSFTPNAPPTSEPAVRTMNGSVIATTETPAPVAQPVSQVSAIFNGHNQTVLEELREFAKGRTNYESALQEHQFLADSDAYMQFVCHAMVRRVIEVERVRVNGR